MKPSSKAFAIIASIVIVGVCLVYALTQAIPNVSFGSSVDVSMPSGDPLALESGDKLEIRSNLSGVTVTVDGNARGVSARLYGSFVGFGGEPELTVSRSGDTVTVRAGRDGIGFIGWSSNMKLDVVIPAGFSGDLSCESSAGPVALNADLSLKSLYAHSSAGQVTVQNVTAQGSVEVSSSAGKVQTGDVIASTAKIETSAGRVDVRSCKASKVKIHSSAGGVSAGGLSGKIEASSSAGPVNVTLLEVTDDADVWSSAGGVQVTLPNRANAGIEASSSAGSVTVSGLDLAYDVKKRDKVTGRLGDGGPNIKIHSSAGSVDVKGE